MSQSTDILEKLKTLLGMQVTLEQMELENGTVLEAESFEKGKEVFIKTDDDEKVALPEGLYDLQDGKKLIVIDEGIIDEIRKDNPNDQKEDMEDPNLKEETVLEEKKDEKQEMTYATKEELAEVKTMVEEIKAMIEAKDHDEKEKKMSAEVEEQQEQKELKEELSKPAANAIKHSPEIQAPKREVLHSQNRSMTTLDKVMQRISKINN